MIIVSGLPRSGTSMMMRLLASGGLTPLVDDFREADEDNPRGYFEFERVKGLPADADWLNEAVGRPVKVISGLLEHLPDDRSYRVLFMRRHLDEVLASQRRMLQRRGKPAGPEGDPRMADLFSKHLEAVEGRILTKPCFEVCWFDYANVIAAPLTTAATVDEFLGLSLDRAAMAASVDSELYRQRRAAS
jgi:hypothetical protein